MNFLTIHAVATCKLPCVLCGWPYIFLKFIRDATVQKVLASNTDKTLWIPGKDAMPLAHPILFIHHTLSL